MGFLGLIVLVLGFVVLQPQQSHAWADLGHQIVGDIAEQNLTPKGKDFVRGVLGVEALGVAATWPDHHRSDQRFAHRHPDPEKQAEDNNDFNPFHFCEIPVGDTWTSRARKPLKDCYGAIKNGIKLLADKTASREEKMIALRYLVHVVGDIHQPLHVGNGYDRGGNSCEVKWSNGYALKLHEVWDSNVVRQLGEDIGDLTKADGAGALRYYPDYTKALKARNPDMFKEAAKLKYAAGLDVVAWLEEASQLRESIVYPDKASDMKDVKKGEEYKNRAYCTYYLNQDKDSRPAPGSKVDKTKIPQLDKPYLDKAMPVVEQQLLKAGVRLAAVIDSIALLASSPKPIDDKEQDRIINAVQDALRNK